ncbi:MAG: beta-glucoside-specific PTS transporter subunit IIABC [Corynebacterium sp.]|uniref:beta-glucoside-specific PTS transporter subunit IIABC n=1 Tax=Corynebacterium sp. TaxID=1720 RepID=UPI0026DCEC93|nr:beta-glucoside-specific PTS transporter subunit IIABC [Corynebacterium sp.]MDO5097330.1 beta-glucoside-specific PTS transporter subunit IIABC [Corynebacterium sp.]
MSEKVRDYPKLARDIIELVGDRDNVRQVSRCATRLRLELKTTPEGAHEKVGELPGVITVVEKGGQFQVVIGNHVGDVYEVVVDELDLDPEAAETGAKPTVLNRIIAMMSAVFAPFIYVLAAAGLIQGLLIIAKSISPSVEQTGAFEIFTFISWTPFTFLPILIAITAAQFFKVNPFIAVVCAAALVNPDFTAIASRIADGETVSFFGIALSPTTYTSTVLPPLILVWVLSYLERWCRKVLPGVVVQLFTPLICIAIMVPLTILAIGPISAGGANFVANGYNWLVDFFPPLAAAIIGGFWQVLVIFGVHWGVTPMVLANFDQYGFDSFQAFQTVAVIGQVGAAFGVFIKSRSKEMKQVAASASLTGIFGITEPAIYGVTLRLKKPFVCGCVAGAVGAVVVALFGSKQYVYAGLPGPLTIMNAYSPGTNSLLGEVIGCCVSFFGAILLVQFIGFIDPVDKDAKVVDAEEAENYAAKAAETGVLKITSPISGAVMALEDVDDPVFATGSMGRGVAIKPTDNKVYAPFAGEIATLFPSGHAVGLISDDGVEVLIHVGIDTVTLGGAPFTSHVAKGDRVEAGELLLEFDSTAIEEAGLSTVTPVLVTNSKMFSDLVVRPIAKARHGDEILVLVPELEAAQQR